MAQASNTSGKPLGSERVLKRHRPSLRDRYVQPVVVKQGGLFLLCTDVGDIQGGSDQGLYFHDMRYLSVAGLQICGREPVSLLADAGDGHRAAFELTNPDIQEDSGNGSGDGPSKVVIAKEALAIRREKVLGDDYVETIAIQNYGGSIAPITLALVYAADFADMFVVRGTHPGRRGTLHHPRWEGGRLIFQYDGADGYTRRTELAFSRTPDRRDAGMLAFQLDLNGRASWKLMITCSLSAEPTDGAPTTRREQFKQLGSLEKQPRDASGAHAEDRQRARSGALGSGARVKTSNPLLDRVIARSFMDLHILRMRQHDQTFFAAGVPWYVALFGRDSLVTSLEVAAFEPDICANTLRVLAGFQGTKVDDWRDEQPGKILHEFRVDEMAHLNEIPQTPYYGSVDSTPLFLIALGAYSAWSGSLDLFHELRDNVTRALDWIDRFGDQDGDGFIDYKCRSSRGGRNQGWKDSANGIVMEDGSLAEPPIALPEVQGDVYLAWMLMAQLFERDGDAATADRLRRQAGRLFDAFNRAFWLPDQKYYAFCRQGDGRFSKSVASNAAHALWTGIIRPERAADVVRRVLESDMFSGWGVRTLSADDVSYNPIDYQVGSVWPHDNAIIVAGMQRYGFSDAVDKVFGAIVDAAERFEHYRLPEVFAGYDRGSATRPVKYPVACNPQAWAAGSVPLMLTALLGLEPDGFNRQLHIKRPHLPSFLDRVEVTGLRIAGGRVDLTYERFGGSTRVKVGSKRGDIDVVDS